MKGSQSLTAWLKTSKSDGLLITQPENIGYLTGFWGSFGMYLQTLKGAWLLTDGRYETTAKALEKKGLFKVIILSGDGPSDFTAHAEGVLTVEDSLTIAQLKAYRRWFKGVKLKPQSGVVEILRKVKTNNELQIMREAQNHVDATLIPFLAENLRLDITEEAFKFKLDQALQQNGKYGLSFDSIVGFGPGSASPHYVSGDRKLKQGDNILIDCGVTDRHYCSDMTRNFVFGTANPAYMKDYENLLNAQQETLKKVKVGAKTKALDAFCRKQMGEAAAFFTHSLGHGVGLEVHELPNLSSRSKDTLQLGEVVTIEPGIYRAGEYGIRIEDCVIVEDGGAEILTQTTKDLLSFNEFGDVQVLHKVA